MNTPYYTFNREERNLAAILYHLLLTGEQNLGRFLELVDHTAEWPLNKCEVYFEYAWLRDDWHRMDAKLKRAWIEARLPSGVIPPTEDRGEGEWNKFFGLTEKPSNKFIQSPANWVLSRVSDTVIGDGYRQLALLKWAFNIKPDLVIITGDKRAVCIETKVESGAGKYPTSKSDKAVWKARLAGEYVDQLDCQRNLFEKVLKFPKEVPGSKDSPMRYVLLDTKGKGIGDVKGLRWKDVFKVMDRTSSHPMVASWLKGLEIA